MPRNIPLKSIVGACISGIEEAQREYEEWTGGWSARYAPESFTQIEIARQLNKIGCPAVSLEDMVHDLISLGQGETRGKKPGKNLGRVDITTWHQSSEPRFIIEIKKTNKTVSLRNDINRLGKLTDKCPKINAGLLVVITSAKKEITLEDRIKKWESEYSIKASGKSKVFYSKSKSDKSYYVVGIVFSIKSQHR